MKLEINLPFSMSDFKLSGVYRIQFEDGSFYIGGSNNVRSRASEWKTAMEDRDNINPKSLGSKVLSKILNLNSAYLEIVELCYEIDLRDKESFYLDKYRSDPKMVSNNDSGAWKAVLQYTKSGVFVKKHYSIEGAARYNNTNLYGIQRVLSGERNSCKDMVFIYEHDYHERRKKIIKRRYHQVVEKKSGRNIIMLNFKNEVVDTFKTGKDAALAVGCHVTGVFRVLNGFQKSAGGYNFKYENK